MLLSSILQHILPHTTFLHKIGVDVTSYLPESILEATAPSALCCHALAGSFPGNTFLPSSPEYSATQANFWSLTTRILLPACIFKPEAAEDVSGALKILTTTAGGKCEFSIRSGGHTPWGPSNAPGGITMDLEKLRRVAVSKDRKVTSIGAGNRWGDVYEKLDAMGLTVVGGRVSEVGVGGLLTGGGVSFLSPRYGLGADNVLNFQIALASGEIVNANSESNPDLFWAMKGGSNNFGVVTRFDLRTIELPPTGQFWGGGVFYDAKDIPKHVEAFNKYTRDNTDRDSALITSFAFDSASGAEGVYQHFVHTNPPQDIINGKKKFPKAFEMFQDIPELFSMTRMANHSDLVRELAELGKTNWHQIFHTATYANDEKLIKKVIELSKGTYDGLKDVKNMTWAWSIQPLTTLITSQFEPNGGNPIGLTPNDGKDGNQILICTYISWQHAPDSERMRKATWEFSQKADDYARSVNKMGKWLYLNYCSEKQDPISSYGPENVRRLRAISKKYDPSGVFQRQVKRGYKLFKETEFEHEYSSEVQKKSKKKMSSREEL